MPRSCSCRPTSRAEQGARDQAQPPVHDTEQHGHERDQQRRGARRVRQPCELLQRPGDGPTRRQRVSGHEDQAHLHREREQLPEAALPRADGVDDRAADGGAVFERRAVEQHDERTGEDRQADGEDERIGNRRAEHATDREAESADHGRERTGFGRRGRRSGLGAAFRSSCCSDRIRWRRPNRRACHPVPSRLSSAPPLERKAVHPRHWDVRRREPRGCLRVGCFYRTLPPTP